MKSFGRRQACESRRRTNPRGPGRAGDTRDGGSDGRLNGDNPYGGMLFFASAEAGSIDDRRRTVQEAKELAERWPELNPEAKRAMLQRLIQCIAIRQDVVDIAPSGFDPRVAGQRHRFSPTFA